MCHLTTEMYPGTVSLGDYIVVIPALQLGTQTKRSLCERNVSAPLNLMGPPGYVASVVDPNIIMQRMAVTKGMQNGVNGRSGEMEPP